MNTRENKLVVMTLILFVLYGIYSFVVYQNVENKSNEIDALLSLVSSGSGYSNYKLHSIIYMFLFVLLIRVVVNKIDEQVLIRNSRERIIKKIFFKLSINTVKFVLSFLIVRIIATTLFIDFDFLVSIKYYLRESMYLVLLCFYYLIFSYVYLLSYIKTLDETKSVFITILVSVGFLVIDILNCKIWVPLKLVGYTDKIFSMDGFNVMLYLNNLLIGIIIIIIFKVVIKSLFMKKDILAYED